MKNGQLSKRIGLLLMMFCSFTLVCAQISVSGKVMDEANEPVIGANVMLKGGKTGTITDMNGMFKISVPGKSSVLVISFIGYASKEVTVGNKKTLNVCIERRRSHFGRSSGCGVCYREKKRLDRFCRQSQYGGTE